ncbi:hypothetical protein C8Q76DRAFT_631422 [Earliella scabrosa]|nr:hypothetical protein C8Q76DRAFT_631422 [Earliella scabrosa]
MEVEQPPAKPGETFEPRFMCCVYLSGDGIIRGPPGINPLLFTVAGEIDPRECYFTTQGVQRPLPPNVEIASCWIRARPNPASRIHWRGMQHSVNSLATHIQDQGGRVDTSRLIAVDEDGSVRLQVIWRGKEGQTIARNMLMFDNDGTREAVPRSLTEVAYGEAFEFVFTIQYVQPRDRQYVLFAALYCTFRA